MRKLKAYLQRFYRLTLAFEKQEKIVWNDLKKLHADAKWSSGVYESDQYIETVFEISPEEQALFYYMIYDGAYHCRVKMFEGYPEDLTTEMFLLATHFNNLMKNGKVIINVKNQYVEYHLKTELLMPLLYTGEIHGQMKNHHHMSKDVFWAFKKLIDENEAPAIIIADLLKMNSQEEKDKE